MAEHAAGVGAVIVAGGSGERFGTSRPKQFVPLRGEPILLWAIRAFATHPEIGPVVVVLPSAIAEDPPSWVLESGAEVVAGGEQRSDSVWNGLCALPRRCEIALVHDGARPFVSFQLISDVIAGARAGGAIAAVPITDTVKRASEDAAVLATENRAGLWAAQTPQGFPFEVLMGAYRSAREAGVSGTDDAELVERIGGIVRLVEGSRANLKITVPSDLAVAEALAAVLG